jgi:recombination protein RecA
MAIEQLLNDFNKVFGENTIRLGSNVEPIHKIPTGNPAFDYVSDGGVPINRITELLGLEASTKTFHSLLSVREFQRTDWSDVTPNVIKQVIYKEKTVKTKDGVNVIPIVESIVSNRRDRPTPTRKLCAFIDFEGTFVKEWAIAMGVDVEGLIYCKPSTLEQAVDIASALLSNEDICLVVFDSMVAGGAAGEVEKSAEDNQMAQNARFWNKSIRTLQSAMNRNPKDHVTLIIINSYSTKVGYVMGDPLVPKNGIQIKLAKSLSVAFSPLKKIVEKVGGEDIVVGRNINVENLKNKCGKALRKSSFFFQTSDTPNAKAGTIDNVGTLVELGCKFNLIERAGAWFTYGENRAQGLEGLKKMLTEKKLIGKLSSEVYEKF